MNVRELFSEVETADVRDCADLHDLSDTKSKNYHTMGKKLFPYVNTKFTDDQVKLIEKCLLENTVIEAHGAHPDHIPYLLQVNNLEQIPFENGMLKMERPHKNLGKKFFNYERPFFIRVRSKLSGTEKILLITFPSAEYLSQYTELLNAFIKLNLQQIERPLKGIPKKEKSKYIPRLSFSKEEASSQLQRFLERAKIQQFSYPLLLETIAEWTGLNQLMINGVISEGDIVVIGYVQQLRERLINEHSFCELPTNSDGFHNFGLGGMYGISVLGCVKSNNRVVLLGCTQSFWGQTSASICECLLHAGAKEIVYFAKAGTFNAKVFDDEEEDPNKGFLKVIGYDYLIWEGDAKNRKGIARTVAVDGKSLQSPLAHSFIDGDFAQSHKHISVPTVVGEDAEQSQSYNDLRPGSIDNEISYIAEVYGKFKKDFPKKDVKFTCLHLMTDFVTSRASFQMAANSGLDEDELNHESKINFFNEVTPKVRAHISRQGSPYNENLSLEHLEFITTVSGGVIQADNPHSENNILSDRFEPNKATNVIKLFDLQSGDQTYLELLSNPKQDASFLVTGEAGVGKSVLAESSYVYLKTQFLNNHSSLPPLLVNLSSYEKVATKSDKNSPEEILETVFAELAETLSLQGPSVILVDGVDENSIFNDALSSSLKKFLKSKMAKQSMLVFFCRRYRSKNFGAEAKIQIGGIDIRPERSFIIGHDGSATFNTAERRQKLSRILSLITGIERKTIAKIRDQMEALPEFSINLRLLHLMTVRAQDGVVIKPEAFFEEFFAEYISRNRSRGQVDEMLVLAAEYSFNFLIEGIYNKISNKDDALIKRISTQSLEMTCYLAANYLDVRIFDKLDYNNDRVFPYLINKYAKALMHKRDQAAALETLAVSLEKASMGSLRFRGFLTYLIGRIDDSTLNDRCAIILNNELTKLNDIEIADKTNELPLKLAHERSVEISLIYTGQSSKDYLNKIITDPLADSVNRGFHLSYYGDYNYFAKESMVIEDDCKTDFSNTFKSILKNIRDSTNPFQWNLSVYTIFSLVFARIGKPETRRLLPTEDLVDLAEKHILNNSLIFEEVGDYVDVCLNYLRSSLMPDVLMIRNALSLKEHIRRGWQLNPRNVKNPETVFAHIGSVAFIASFYLPENSKINELNSRFESGYDKYDKDKIIRMLLLHDVGEFVEGDIPSPIKTDKNRAIERGAMTMFRVLPRKQTRHDLIAFDYTAFELWDEFTKGNTVNAKVAKDLDTLECMIQLEAYHSEEPGAVPDFKEFWNSLYDNLRTGLSRGLVDLICERKRS